jgi:glycosyltransferase involved in cell wall biosynthesis
MTADEIDVTVILPVYNEEGHLADEVERISEAMSASPYSYEILIVDDGSTDGSALLARNLESEREHIRTLQFMVNRGSGSVRRAGTQAARGRVVVWTDADMSYPNERIPELVKEMEGWDQIVGARTSEQGTRRALRVPAKLFIRKLAEFLTRTKIPDLNSGLRAFRRDVALQYLHLLPAGFSCVTTITMTFLANGYSVKYIPIEYAKRAGNSKFHWRADTRRYITQVVRMVLSYAPLRFFLPVGITLFLVATGKLIFDIFDKDFHLAANTLLLFFAAFQTIVLGLLADLVVRATSRPDRVPPTHL